MSARSCKREMASLLHCHLLVFSCLGITGCVSRGPGPAAVWMSPENMRHYQKAALDSLGEQKGLQRRLDLPILFGITTGDGAAVAVYVPVTSPLPYDRSYAVYYFSPDASRWKGLEALHWDNTMPAPWPLRTSGRAAVSPLLDEEERARAILGVDQSKAD